MTRELFGIAMAIGLAMVLGVVLTDKRTPRILKRLIYGALALRVVGALLRYTILFDYYGGSGDAVGYFNRGLTYASRFTRLDFSPFYDSGLWLRGQWWGTSFLSFPSGIVLSIIGPSLRGEFIVFALLSFLGLVGFATAFRRSYPHIPLENYARWIFLFPSLWYWPASLGKEAIILLGVGLVVSGFFGQRGRKHWPTLFFGTFLVFAVRPQVCAVLLFSLVLAHWLSIGGRWTPRKVTQGVVILTLGSAGILQGMSLSGVESFDVEGIQDYMETDQARSTGGSSVGTVDIGLTGVPMAFLNIVARPFIWEAGNVMALVSALEVLLFWSIVWYRRRNLRRALHEWRLHPMLRLAVPFVLIYSVSLGLMVVNLGIIARQRIFLFPFLFLLLEAAPAAGQSIHRRGRRPPRPSAGRPSRLLIGTPHR